MNISQMMRGLLGDTIAGDSRAMELKAGQVVRGVVLQMLENNEAVVQINGVQVRAKLEVPLQPGQSAMLQVQPESNGSVITLKPVDLSASGLLDDTFRDYAKLLGLPDQRWALDIIKDLRREGFPFNRMTSRAFQEAAASMPQGADQEQWMQATAATFKRGLPMTAATIGSMEQAMFGKGTHELLDTLKGQLGSFIASEVEMAQKEGKVTQAAARVLALLEQGAALLRGAPSSSERVNAHNIGTNTTAVQTETEKIQGSSLVTQIAANSSDDINTIRSGSERAVATSANWLSGMMKWLGVDHELQLAKAATAEDQLQAGSNSRKSTPASDNRETMRSQVVSSERAGQAPLLRGTDIGAVNVTISSNLANTTGAPNLVNAGNGSNLVDAETYKNVDTDNGTAIKQDTSQLQGGSPRAALQTNLLSGSLYPILNQDASGLDISGASQNPQGVQQQATGQDSMKSALLTLMASNDTPAAIKETAQQLIHQITGQQLLLAPERNSSVFTHVTMFIPLQDQHGSSTASVHIQTRRGRRGELDADNCRLLFNLSMKSLGDTLVDVNVTDKIVSLNVWNDHPAITELIEGSRADITDRLKETGYQLLSLRSTPLPTNSDDTTTTEQKVKRQVPPDLSQFSSTRYKGVDFKA
ncbi:hypothetical protein [Paenibacillus sp. L3-i20]|uniref:hypothetical protein n=1 Tax=Paenibacillus sp. L3-i20 TaxID=2905833 RepID=UPI001EDD1317|nr:hypothetical protein [Paenibacillus sp. L3-i20]GKU78607.1 hypothetical protein L3i20_v230040 [Paenibacillus sp. L3-i20]